MNGPAAPGVDDARLARIALEGSGIGLWEWDIAGDDVRWLNDWCRQAGIEAASGQDHDSRWLVNLHPDDVARYREVMAAHRDGRLPRFVVEYRMRAIDGRWIWVEERGCAVDADERGRPTRSTGLCIDATDRHRMSEALRQSEGRVEVALWGSEVGFWEYDPVLDEVTWWNDWCAGHGLDPCVGPGHRERWNARIHPDDRARRRTLSLVTEGPGDEYAGEYRVRRIDGEWHWILSRGRATARDARGRATRIVGVTIDIDEAKRAADALAASEVRLAAAVWGAGIGLWDADDVAGTFRWFDDWCERCGIDPCDDVETEAGWEARMHPEDRVRYRAAVVRAAAGAEDHYEVEYRELDRAGRWRWLLERGRVTGRDSAGRATTYVGLCLDIDARKRLAFELDAAKARYELAINAARLPVWEYDVATDRYTANVHWHRALGRTVSEAEAAQRVDRWSGGIHPDDATAMREAYASIGGAIDADGFYEVEYRVATESGEYKWMLDRARVVERDAAGRPGRVVGISLDIDVRKRTELSLRDSEARLEAAVGGADIGIWERDVRGNTLRWLSDWPMRYGIDPRPGPATGGTWLARIHPEDRARMLLRDGEALRGRRQQEEGDYRLLDRHGEWRWVHIRARVVERDRHGHARRMVGACIDVDARRRVEEALRAQAAILDAMREGVVLADLDGRVELANPAFERMFGAAPGALTGAELGTLLRRPRSETGGLLERLAEGGVALELRLRRANGEEFTAEAVARRLARDGRDHWLVVLDDVSERKELEREVLEIANRERHRLGSDLHDGLGQELTGIALLLRSLATRQGRGTPPAPGELEQVVELVNGAIDSTRAMARGLAPVSLDHDGLVSALRDLTARLRDTAGVEVRLRTQIRGPLALDSATANHLYRIAQEALTNAVKHSAARSVTVRLATDATAVRLTVSDDGRGLPPPASRTGGMGLRIMEYRARLLGGTLSLGAAPGGGTRIACVVPRAAAPAASLRRDA